MTTTRTDFPAQLSGAAPSADKNLMPGIGGATLTPRGSPIRETLMGDPATNNIEAIARIEREALERRTLVDKMGDAVTGVLGTMTAVLIHVAVIALWVLVNLRIVP